MEKNAKQSVLTCCPDVCGVKNCGRDPFHGAEEVSEGMS